MADKVAKVIILRGDVSQSYQQKTHPLHKGDWIQEKAIIRTAEKSFVKLLFQDNTQMSLGPKSEAIISKFVPKKAGIVSLVQGQLRSKVAKNLLELSKKETTHKFFVKTESAAMGVRGTDFQVIYNPVNNVTNLITFSGTVAMAKIDSDSSSINKNLTNSDQLNRIVSSDRAVIVTEGQFSGVLPGQEQASLPVKIFPAQFETMKRNTDMQQAAVTTTGENTSNKNHFQSPIPKGVSAKSFMNNNNMLITHAEKSFSQSAETESAKESGGQKFKAPPPEGINDPSTGKYAPPAGGFIDINTGIYVPPPSGSTFDSNTGVYIPPPDFGGFNAKTGEYVPPSGVVLDDSGQFVTQDVKKQIDTARNTATSGSNNKSPEEKSPLPALLPSGPGFLDKGAMTPISITSIEAPSRYNNEKQTGLPGSSTHTNLYPPPGGKKPDGSILPSPGSGPILPPTEGEFNHYPGKGDFNPNDLIDDVISDNQDAINDQQQNSKPSTTVQYIFSVE